MLGYNTWNKLGNESAVLPFQIDYQENRAFFRMIKCLGIGHFIKSTLFEKKNLYFNISEASKETSN